LNSSLIGRRALNDVLLSIPEELITRIVSLAFDGTSGTTMLVDGDTGESLEPPKWYNEAQSTKAQNFASVCLIL